jgi:peptide/nickel transport system substrate-binding protein
VWARYGDADSLDPQRTTTTLSWQIFDQLYDTLLAFDASGKIVPNLAKDWQVSPDGKAVTFTLNQSLTCHDGTPFDAKDVKYTADRALDKANPSVTKGAWGPISAVEVVDPQTVKFTFDKPFGAFTAFMANPLPACSVTATKRRGLNLGSPPPLALAPGSW